MILLSSNIEDMDRLSFHRDANGSLIPVYDGQLFTGTVIDHHGELVYDSGSLIDIVEYDGRVLH